MAKTSGRTTVKVDGAKYSDRLKHLKKQFSGMSLNQIIETFAAKGAEYYDSDHTGEFLADANN